MTVLPIACGALVGIASLHSELGWLALPALVVWFGSLSGRPFRHLSLNVALFALTNFSMTWHWLFGVLQGEIIENFRLGATLLVGLLLLAALVFVALARIASALDKVVPVAIGFPVLIAANEVWFPEVLGAPFPPTTLFLLNTPLAKLAALGGQPLLTLAILLTASGLAVWLEKPVVPALVVALVLHFWPQDGVELDGNQSVSVIQTGHDADSDLGALLEEAASLAPDIILLPENVLQGPLETGSDPFSGIKHNIPVLFGATHDTLAEKGKYSVSVFLRDRFGTHAIYDKRHLVPFFETNPIPRLFPEIEPLAKGVGQQGVEYSPGQFLYPMLCFEVLFPALRVAGYPRSNWIALLASDKHFDSKVGQHLLQKFAQLRALETGLPLVRVSDTGISAVIYPSGKIRHEMAFGSKVVEMFQIPRASPATAFWNFGSAVFWAAGTITLFSGIVLKRKKTPNG